MKGHYHSMPWLEYTREYMRGSRPWESALARYTDGPALTLWLNRATSVYDDPALVAVKMFPKFWNANSFMNNRANLWINISTKIKQKKLEVMKLVF